MARKKRRKDKSKLHLGMELLEARQMLASDLSSIFARFDGQLPGRNEISISVRPEDFFVLTRDVTRLGFLLEAADGSALNPAAVDIAPDNGGQSHLQLGIDNIRDSETSLAMYDLAMYDRERFRQWGSRSELII